MGKARAAVYGMAGIYLLFLCYNMFVERRNSEGAEYIILVIAMVVFVILGLGFLLISYKMMRKPTQEPTKESTLESESEPTQELPQESAQEPVNEPKQEREGHGRSED